MMQLRESVLEFPDSHNRRTFALRVLDVREIKSSLDEIRGVQSRTPKRCLKWRTTVREDVAFAEGLGSALRREAIGPWTAVYGPCATGRKKIAAVDTMSTSTKSQMNCRGKLTIAPARVLVGSSLLDRRCCEKVGRLPKFPADFVISLGSRK